MDKALSDIRVIEFGRGEGLALFGRYMAELGAEVIKVESPEGDPLRAVPPMVGSRSYAFEILNPGKRSLVLDINSDDGRKQLVQLMGTADIVVESYCKPSWLRSVGLDYETIHEQYPSLIYVALSGYGYDTEWADKPWSDITAQATAGAMLLMGSEEDDPVKSGAALGEFTASAEGAAGALMALYYRDDTARGQLIDIAAVDTIDVADACAYAGAYHDKQEPWRAGLKHPMGTPYDAYPCKDGQVVLGCSGDPQFFALAKAMGMPELLDDPKVNNAVARRQNLEYLDEMLNAWLADKTTMEAGDIARSAGVPASSLADMDHVINDPQLAVRNMIVEVETDDGKVTMGGSQFGIMSETPGEVTTAAPKLGEASVDEFMGRTPTLPENPIERDPSKGPLDGLTELGFARYLASPECGVVLEGFGARVIKIEPLEGDLIRILPPTIENSTASNLFDIVNSGVEAICLNLREEKAQELAKQLVARADLLVENNSTKVMRKYNLMYDDVKDINPDLIYCSESGFGYDGPKADWLAFDQVIQGESGMLSLNGTPGHPARTGDSSTDMTGPFFAIISMMAALHYRRRVDKGQYIETAMLDMGFMTTYSAWPAYFVNNEVLRSYGNTYPFACPYNGYHAANDDMVVIGVNTDDEWKALLGVMGDAASAISGYGPIAERLEHQSEIDAAVEAWVNGKAADDITAACDAADVPSAKVVSILTHIEDPLFKGRQMHLDLEHPNPEVGVVRTTGLAIKMSETPGKITKLAPELGEDTEKILVGEMGIKAQDFKELESEGVVL